ncbi:MAG: amino acid ABC transporter permease, partial [Blautia sp.]
MEALRDRFIINFVSDDRWRYITDGLKVTLEVTFLAVLLGIALGFFVAIVRSTYDKTHKLR